MAINGFEMSSERELVVQAYTDRPGITGDCISLLINEGDKMAAFQMDETMAMKMCGDVLAYLDRRRKERSAYASIPKDKEPEVPAHVVPMLELDIKPEPVPAAESQSLKAVLKEIEEMEFEAKKADVAKEPTPVLKEDRHIVVRKRRSV